MTSISEITDAFLDQSRKEMATRQLENAARPIGTTGVRLDFYTRSEADKPISDGEMTINGQKYSWTGSRWAVWLVRWTGTDWRNVRRLTGPKTLGSELYADRSALSKKRGIPVVD
jgi:hypothetical protein